MGKKRLSILEKEKSYLRIKGSAVALKNVLRLGLSPLEGHVLMQDAHRDVYQKIAAAQSLAEIENIVEA